MHPRPTSIPLLLLFAASSAGCAGGPRTGGSGGSASCPSDRTVAPGTQDEVERLAGCTSLSGVTIRTGAPLDLAPLRSLETITGDLVIGPTVGLEELSLAELREVRGSIHVVSNNSLAGLFLPRLERAGRIAVEGNSALTTISMPRLDAVESSLIVSGNGGLELLDVNAVTRIGKDLVVTDNPKLALVEAARLTSVLEVRVEDNRGLPEAQVQALRAKTPAP
ncbi:MAG: hypothetical protein SFX73_24545 [Kofleriaceae bacterium]|nr:hypothetical protein [Kofleriaceae bacterium]